MPLYKYQAKDLYGKQSNGTMEAPDAQMVYTTLRESELFATSVREKSQNVQLKPMKAKELAEFSNQLGTMLSAGISLSRTLSIIAKRTENKRLKDNYMKLYTSVKQGILLSDAMQEMQDVFPVLMINMVRAGENSGQMAEISMKMASHYEKDSRLQSKIKSAMAYPMFLLVLVVVVIMVIFTMILPRIFGLFEGMELPIVTRIVRGFSVFLQEHFLVAIVVIILTGCVIALLLKTGPVRYFVDKMKLSMPVLAPIFKIIYTARFARGLSSLYSSGLPMLQSLQICKGLIGNRYMEEQFETMIIDVKNGVPLSTTMNKMSGWDSKLIASIYVGEESGRINEILSSLADSFDYEADQATQRLISIAEPVMIVVLGVIVGSVVLSVMLPMMQYYQSIA